MTQRYAPMDAGAGANVLESQWASMARNWALTGVLAGQLNGLEVYANGADYNARVKTGRACVEGVWYENDTEVALPIVAHATLYRRDRIVLAVDWNANTVALVVLAGGAATTAAGTTVPELTQTLGVLWHFPLAVTLVRPISAASALLAADMLDERRYARGLGTDMAYGNQLTNGNYAYWPGATTGLVGDGTETALRWKIAGALSTLTVGRESSTVDPGGQYSLKAVLSGYGGAVLLAQWLENYLELTSQIVTYAQRVWTNNPLAVRLRLTDGVTDYYSAYHPADSAWHLLTITAPIGAAPASLAACVSFDAACTAWLANAGLYPGYLAPDRFLEHPADQWQRNERYYQRFGGEHTNEIVAAGYCVSTTQALFVLPFAQRGNPGVAPAVTVGTVGNWSVMNAGGTGQTCTALTATRLTTKNVLLTATVASGLVAGQGTLLQALNTSASIEVRVTP